MSLSGKLYWITGSRVICSVHITLANVVMNAVTVHPLQQWGHFSNEYTSPVTTSLPAPIVSSLCFKERNLLNVVSVVSVQGTTQPWSNTCGLMVGLRPISVQSAWSSAAVWLPCRDTSRATQCRTSLQTGVSTAPTCTHPTFESSLRDSSINT